MRYSVPLNPLTSVTIKSVNSLLISMTEEYNKNICRNVVEISLFADKQKMCIFHSAFHLRLIVKTRKKEIFFFFLLEMNNELYFLNMFLNYFVFTELRGQIFSYIKKTLPQKQTLQTSGFSFVVSVIFLLF